jgi:hypothetical protein
MQLFCPEYAGWRARPLLSVGRTVDPVHHHLREDVTVTLSLCEDIVVALSPASWPLDLADSKAPAGSHGGCSLDGEAGRRRWRSRSHHHNILSIYS